MDTDEHELIVEAKRILIEKVRQLPIGERLKVAERLIDRWMGILKGLGFEAAGVDSASKKVLLKEIGHDSSNSVQS